MGSSSAGGYSDFVSNANHVRQAVAFMAGRYFADGRRVRFARGAVDCSDSIS